MEGSANNSNEGIDVKADEGGGSGSCALEGERLKLAEEFNVQRAKMKELFLQKEGELRRFITEKEHLESEIIGLRAQLDQLQTLSENQKSEIESLQLLIHETVEASSSGTEEVRRLQTRNLELEQQLNFISKQKAAEQEAPLAPAAIVRSLARRLGADTDSRDEEAARNTSRHMDDPELQRSLVESLEEEIKVLKEKLRETDNQLQVARQSKITPKGDSGEVVAHCDMCVNYEKQLVAEQARCEEARARARDAERQLKLAREELEGARAVQEEAARACRNERGVAATQLAELRAILDAARAQLQEKVAAAEAATRRALFEVTALTVQRETLQHHLDTLQKENDMLVGKYTKKASELQNEDINLPDTVEELQEVCLRQHEELIAAALGRERALSSEAELRPQLLSHAAAYREVVAARDAVVAERDTLRQELDRLQTEREQMNELADKLRQSNMRIEDLLEDKKRLTDEVAEQRSRILSLQQDLDNNEKVQQDFVRLSQSLQVQLERIREADTEVRWQHEDDVSVCPSCHVALTNNKQKVHCRHCGRIFCATCASHGVASGPRRRTARVCAVCRTLLQPHAAPYFSTDPPPAPD